MFTLLLGVSAHVLEDLQRIHHQFTEEMTPMARGQVALWERLRHPENAIERMQERKQRGERHHETEPASVLSLDKTLEALTAQIRQLVAHVRSYNREINRAIIGINKNPETSFEIKRALRVQVLQDIQSVFEEELAEHESHISLIQEMLGVWLFREPIFAASVIGASVTGDTVHPTTNVDLPPPSFVQNQDGGTVVAQPAIRTELAPEEIAPPPPIVEVEVIREVLRVPEHLEQIDASIGHAVNTISASQAETLRAAMQNDVRSFLEQLERVQRLVRQPIEQLQAISIQGRTYSNADLRKIADSISLLTHALRESFTETLDTVIYHMGDQRRQLEIVHQPEALEDVEDALGHLNWLVNQTIRAMIMGQQNELSREREQLLEQLERTQKLAGNLQNLTEDTCDTHSSRRMPSKGGASPSYDPQSLELGITISKDIWAPQEDGLQSQLHQFADQLAQTGRDVRILMQMPPLVEEHPYLGFERVFYAQPAVPPQADSSETPTGSEHSSGSSFFVETPTHFASPEGQPDHSRRNPTPPAVDERRGEETQDEPVHPGAPIAPPAQPEQDVQTSHTNGRASPPVPGDHTIAREDEEALENRVPDTRGTAEEQTPEAAAPQDQDGDSRSNSEVDPNAEVGLNAEVVQDDSTPNESPKKQQGGGGRRQKKK